MKTLEEIKKELANIFGYVEELSPREMERLGVEDIKRMKINNLEYRMVCRLLESTISQTKQELIEEIKDFEQKVNQFDISSGAIDDNNSMLIELIGECRKLLKKLSNK